jgi:hypothetical protein
MFLIVAAAIIAVFLACAGCSDDKAVPAATPVTATETTIAISSPATVATETPEPVVTLPEKQDVEIVLSKDRTYSTIHLLYNGGGGEIFTNTIEMRVTTSDGQVADYVMNDGKAPGRGDEIVAQGTRGKDRCEVWVTSAGTRYKVMDEYLIVGGAYEGS